MESFDVVVIGGGIAGVGATYELAVRGLRVLLVEREGQLAYHTTGRSAALFIEGWGPPTVRKLLRASRQPIETIHERLDIDPVVTPRPALIVAEEPDVGAVEQLLRDVPNMIDVGGAGAERRCPQLRPGVIAAAACEPHAYALDVMGLHQGWVRSATGLGARIEKWYDVAAIERHTDGFTVTSSTGRSVRSGQVVLAAGAWTDVLGAKAGARPIGLRPLRRTIAVCRTSVPLDPFGPHVTDVHEKYYWQPEGPNVLISPCDETPTEPCDARPEEEDVARAIDEVNAATTLNIRSVVTTWAGLRTFAPDRSPVCGEDPEIDGLWWLCGQGGYGIETSCAMSASIGSLVATRRLPDHVAAEGVDIDELSPARFGGPPSPSH